MWLAYTFLAVAAGHVLAALKHQWWDDHDILARMTGDRDDRQADRPLIPLVKWAAWEGPRVCTTSPPRSSTTVGVQRRSAREREANERPGWGGRGRCWRWRQWRALRAMSPASSPQARTRQHSEPRRVSANLKEKENEVR